ncbi:MAG TPA: DNA-protecting protein DprA [Paracoccus sp.]|nr:DNA-protecting protein DprA [Paracoccus sp. (in: a-proteobacteria)]
MDGNTFSSPTPFTPPTTEEDRVSWLRLIRSRRVGPGTFARLMTEHGSASAALDALPALAHASGVAAYSPCAPDTALREYQAGLRAGARLLCLGAADYPPALAAIADAPPVLWAIGQGATLAQPAIALVGARNASSLGQRTARKLAEGLGHYGFTIVSGLARGIDTVAHGAALKTGTIAVMAGGVDHIYPAENAALAAAIADQGMRLSEQPMGLPPQARHFPRRNRIIAGLALATVVVEAAEGSGSLITARDALEQGREVLAVPGHPLDARAAGCNALIREGARLVRDTGDVLEAVAPALTAKPVPAPATPAPPIPQLRPRAPDTLTLHRLILDHLGPSPLAEDQLVRDLALPTATIAPALLFLELDGRVQRQPGGLLARS